MKQEMPAMFVAGIFLLLFSDLQGKLTGLTVVTAEFLLPHSKTAGG